MWWAVTPGCLRICCSQQPPRPPYRARPILGRLRLQCTLLPHLPARLLSAATTICPAPTPPSPPLLKMWRFSIFVSTLLASAWGEPTPSNLPVAPLPARVLQAVSLPAATIDGKLCPSGTGSFIAYGSGAHCGGRGPYWCGTNSSLVLGYVPTGSIQYYCDLPGQGWFGAANQPVITPSGWGPLYPLFGPTLPPPTALSSSDRSDAPLPTLPTPPLSRISLWDGDVVDGVSFFALNGSLTYREGNRADYIATIQCPVSSFITAYGYYPNTAPNTRPGM